ncbi:DUF4239 domain-containing protein [Nocardia terpenica]|uniref:bestrophin-like domain n=1 Tax=Nocardia terpenica TaxID=455432 RepID=UPI002FE0A450
MVVFVVGARLRPASWSQTGEENAGTLVLDLAKTFFAAVVAFIVVLCWQQFDSTYRSTVAEANSLAETYWLTHQMPDPEHHRIQGLLPDYTTGVIAAEWPVMARDHRLDQPTQTSFDTLRGSVESMRPADPYIGGLRASALSSLTQVAKARQDRAAAAGHQTPGFWYLLLYFGAVKLLLSPVLSGVKLGRRSVMMTALLGVVVGLVIVLIHTLDHPFSGGYTVSREAFESALSRYTHIT